MSRIQPLKHPAYRAGGFALFIALGAILTALAFEHLGGYKPCPLCLMERWAYYFAIPALFAALALHASDHKILSAFIFFAVALAFLANAGAGIYHAGVEWKFWPGPDTCAATGTLTPLGGSAADLLKSVETTRVIRCDEAPWRMLGLSFAGWNVVASFLAFVAALQAAFFESSR